MVCINSTLINFSEKDLFFSVFEDYNNDFEFTSKGVFRRTTPQACVYCGAGMSHNGYNTYTKKNLGSVKIGRYICPVCRESYEEGREFWENMKTEFFDVLNHVYQILRANHVSYDGISALMDAIFPMGKDTILRAFNDSMDEAEVPVVEHFNIIHYDEQHPKRGRTQKYRLTILDSISGMPIADELYNKKDPETIKAFLAKHLNPNQITFVITDLYPSYPAVLEDFFGKNLIHQFCLLHLNKRIVKDFPRKTTFQQELTKYRLLNIFYNRKTVIETLEEKAQEEKRIKKENTDEEYKSWLKREMKAFMKSLHEKKKERRRLGLNLKQRSYLDAKSTFKKLMDEIDSFEKPVQKRLRKIEKNWAKFTAFYLVVGAPATNNLLENYYSTSLKTHRKKQLRTNRGIKNQMKLSAIKRAGQLIYNGKTLLQIILKFTPFLNTD